MAWYLHNELSDLMNAQQEEPQDRGTFGLSQLGNKINESGKPRKDDLLLQRKGLEQPSKRVVDAIQEGSEERVCLDVQYATELLFELDQAEVAKQKYLAIPLVTFGHGHGSSGRHVDIGRFFFCLGVK
jgi:hypothetical protein